MKQKLLSIFVNALVGAIASAASVWLGASAAEAVAAGSVSSATIGNAATSVANSALEVVKAVIA